MADKCLRSRSIAAVGDGQGNPVVASVDENIVTDAVQITDQFAASDVSDTVTKDLGSVSQQVTMSAVQLQDILASVKQVVQAEISKQTELQTAALEARLTAVSDSLNSKLNSVCENLKTEMKRENEKLAASLTNQFRADNEKLRQELSLDLQTEIHNRAKEIELLKKDTESRLVKINENIDTVSAGMDERIGVHVSQTRKELERNTQEVNQRSKTLIREINDHKMQVDTAVEGIRQELGQTKEGLNRSAESIDNEVKTVSAALQAEKQSTLSEFQKVNLAISRIEAKITDGLATQTQSAVCTTPHHTSLVRAEGIGQGNNKTSVSPLSQSENTSNTSVTGVNTCNASACSVSANNVPDVSCNGSVNALSVVVPNGYADLNELSLPKYNNSAKQVVAHFLRELDEYFAIKKTPNELKLPLCFRAIEDPFAKQWFATVYDTVGTYESFKTAFANLLWGQTRQAQIRCSIYQDRWDRRNEETYAEHYIRYASMASMLNPPLSEEDLVGAMIGHFPPDVQNGMFCGNLKTTQDVLAFLSKMHGLEATRVQHTRPRREYDERDANPKVSRGRTDDAANREGRGNPQNRNTRYVRTTREHTEPRRQSPRRFGRNGESSGWGRSRWQERHSLNPRAQDFEPRTSNREGVTDPSGRGEEPGHGEALNA
jgi:hypothetical protein